jgi:rhamnogalacturonan acetylesterase
MSTKLTSSSWGFYMHNYFNLNITNLARGGRSARSFINEGLWDSLVARIVPGENTFVLIEMGHNDNGDPTTDVKARATLPGIGHESVVVASNATGGRTERVYTFGHYVRKMISDVKHAGGVPVLSGMVPVMSWTGDVLEKNWAFANYERQVCLFSNLHHARAYSNLRE